MKSLIIFLPSEKSFLLLLFVMVLGLGSKSYGQANRGSALNKGDEIQIIWSAPTNTTEYLTSPNERYRFHFDLRVDKEWYIVDGQDNSKKKVEFLPKKMNPQPSDANRALRMESNGNLTYIFYHHPGPNSPSSQMFSADTNTKGGNTFELTDDGTLVVKNAAGVVVWGPVSGN